MWILRTSGALLLILGSLSGIVLLVACGYPAWLSGIAPFIGLFLVGNVAGAVLFAIGSHRNSAGQVFKVAGAILIIIGLLSGIAIFLARLSILANVNDHGLWALFPLCILVGGAAVWGADRLQRNYRKQESKKP